jgi:hypothetical protein
MNKDRLVRVLGHMFPEESKASNTWFQNIGKESPSTPLGLLRGCNSGLLTAILSLYESQGKQRQEVERVCINNIIGDPDVAMADPDTCRKELLRFGGYVLLNWVSIISNYSA